MFYNLKILSFKALTMIILDYRSELRCEALVSCGFVYVLTLWMVIMFVWCYIHRYAIIVTTVCTCVTVCKSFYDKFYRHTNPFTFYADKSITVHRSACFDFTWAGVCVFICFTTQPSDMQIAANECVCIRLKRNVNCMTACKWIIIKPAHS